MESYPYIPQMGKGLTTSPVSSHIAAPKRGETLQHARKWKDDARVSCESPVMPWTTSSRRLLVFYGLPTGIFAWTKSVRAERNARTYHSLTHARKHAPSRRALTRMNAARQVAHIERRSRAHVHACAPTRTYRNSRWLPRAIKRAVRNNRTRRACALYGC